MRATKVALGKSQRNHDGTFHIIPRHDVTRDDGAVPPSIRFRETSAASGVIIWMKIQAISEEMPKQPW